MPGTETSFEVHPIASLFPMMTEEEFAGLKADIAEHGQRDDITIYDGKVLDGRNRQRACEELGIKPKTRQFTGNCPVRFVYSENFHRRHLSSGQKAGVAVKMESMMAELETKAKERKAVGQHKGGGDRKSKSARSHGGNNSPKRSEPKNKTRDNAAELVGTNPRYIDHAKKVNAHDPALLDKVIAGDVKLPQAKREVEREQKREDLKAKAAAAPSPETQTWEIRNADCVAALSRMDHGTARLIFADPPYNIGVDYGDGKKADDMPHDKYVDWCEGWLGLCRDVLTPDGSLWVMIGDEFAAEYACILKHDLGLTIRSWIKWYETFGVNCSNNFNRTSRHIFYCVKDPKKFVFHPEAVNRPSDRQAKYGDSRADPAGKIWDDVWNIPRLVGTAKERIPDFPTQLPLELTRAIVGCASDPGDLVVDPFCGSASTGAACCELGRRFVGIEKQKQFVELATLRLKTYG